MAVAICATAVAIETLTAQKVAKRMLKSSVLNATLQCEFMIVSFLQIRKR